MKGSSLEPGKFLLYLLALLIGIGLGLVYSWFLSPVTYVDANPAILRADFKDQYRLVIASSYASTHDLERAKARLLLLGEADPVEQLSAQAQRMLATGEPFEKARPLAQLATDLRQGYAGISTSTPYTLLNTPQDDLTLTPSETISPNQPETQVETGTPAPTIVLEQTPITPFVAETFTPRPTFTSVPESGPPFILTGQEVICLPGAPSGLLQVQLTNASRQEVAGVEIIITWGDGEDHFFTGFKPEIGDGYADFVMESGEVYSVQVAEGGAFVPDIAIPECTDPTGGQYSGGISLTFQQ